MTQYTTPAHVFSLPFDGGEIRKCRVIYAQGDEVILKKETEDCFILGSTMTVHLTQEETARFDPKAKARVQVHILTKNGNALVSKEIRLKVNDCIDDEVIA